MSCHFIDLFLIIIVHFIDRLCFFIFGTRKQFSFFKSQFTDIHTIFCIIRNFFCNDIFCTIDRIFGIFYFFFLGNIFFRFIFYRCRAFLFQDVCSQSVKSFFFGDRCSGSPLWTIRTIQIVYYNLCFCFCNLFF